MIRTEFVQFFPDFFQRLHWKSSRAIIQAFAIRLEQLGNRIASARCVSQWDVV
jgi:hypothetical protein